MDTREARVFLEYHPRRLKPGERDLLRSIAIGLDGEEEFRLVDSDLVRVWVPASKVPEWARHLAVDQFGRPVDIGR